MIMTGILIFILKYKDVQPDKEKGFLPENRIKYLHPVYR